MDNEAKALVERTMTDPQRMLWRDDVEGLCLSPELCFECGDHVRCAPCAIRQATAHGVSTDYDVPDLPEVSRLQREAKSAATLIERLREASIALHTALALHTSNGCPACPGDCASANPPMMNCPTQAALKAFALFDRAALEAKP